MAYYKVPQDVEAEDKLVFGLTLKQFIFAIIFFVSGFVAFQLAQVSVFLVGLFLPIFVISGTLTFYRPKDQPAETKIAAYVNFWFQPRRRIWSRDGLLEHVHILVPKRPPQQMLVRSKAQVRSQLKNLAQIVDTRGWSVKQNSIQAPTGGIGMIDHDDRLVGPQDIQAISQPVADEPEAIDIMDETVSPLAQSFERMEAVAEEKTRAAALETIRHAQAHAEPTISQVHTTGMPISSVTSTPVTPHFDPYPAGIKQKSLGGNAPSPQAAAKVVESLGDMPISVVAHEVGRLNDAAEVAFEVNH